MSLKEFMNFCEKKITILCQKYFLFDGAPYQIISDWIISCYSEWGEEKVEFTKDCYNTLKDRILYDIPKKIKPEIQWVSDEYSSIYWEHFYSVLTTFQNHIEETFPECKINLNYDNELKLFENKKNQKNLRILVDKIKNQIYKDIEPILNLFLEDFFKSIKSQQLIEKKEKITTVPFIVMKKLKKICDDEQQIHKCWENFHTLGLENNSLSIPNQIYKTMENTLEQKVNITLIEGFSNAVNSNCKKFCSVFHKSEEKFGAIGNFFHTDFENNSLISANPPFINNILTTCAQHILLYLDKHKEENIGFLCCFPRWTDCDSYHILSNCENYLISTYDFSQNPVIFESWLENKKKWIGCRIFFLGTKKFRKYKPFIDYFMLLWKNLGK